MRIRPDDIELVQRLCVIAGTVMEDASVEAVSIISRDTEQRRQRINRLTRAGAEAAALFDAAAILDRQLSEQC